MQFPLLTLTATLLSSSTLVAAICGGSSYGVGNWISLADGSSRWNVYDNNCNIVDGLGTDQNPCDSATFGCSPGNPPIFDTYTSTFNGQTYNCVVDSAGESCPQQYGGTDAISVCCS